MTQSPAPDTPEPASGWRAGLRDPRWWLAAYLLVLAAVVLWPVPVDSGARPLIEAVIRRVHWLNYARIEFAANILLFVPVGVLLALILKTRYLVVPIALVTTVAVESIQAIALDRRTPSFGDVVANLTGAAVGLLLVTVIEHVRARRRPDAPTQ